MYLTLRRSRRHCRREALKRVSTAKAKQNRSSDITRKSDDTVSKIDCIYFTAGYP